MKKLCVNCSINEKTIVIGSRNSYSKITIIDYNYFISRTHSFKMQNINNVVNIFPNQSFYYIPNQLQYYAYLPITPSYSEASTPNTQPNYQSPVTLMFPSHVDHFYYGSDHPSYVHESSTPLNQIRTVGPINLPSIIGSKQKFEAKTCLSLPLEGQSLREEQKRMIKREQQSLYCELGNTILKQKQNNEKRKNIKIEEDRDYIPQLDRKRKQIIKYQQNQNRNVIPNEINQIFSFIQKQNKSGQLVQKLFQKFAHPQSYTTKRYYLYQSLLKNKLGHYTNQKSLKLVTELYEPKCESWSEQEQRYYNKISRVLICHFLYQDSIFIILTSKRMKKDKKSDHLRARRQIFQSVINILKGL